MFCIFLYLCATVYIQLFSFRAASVCLINSVVSCQLARITHVADGIVPVLVLERGVREDSVVDDLKRRQRDRSQ